MNIWELRVLVMHFRCAKFSNTVFRLVGLEVPNPVFIGKS